MQGEERTQVEAVWTIANIAANGNRSQVIYIVNQGVVNPFCQKLSPYSSQVGGWKMFWTIQLKYCYSFVFVLFGVVV